jgi:C4-dicarboxylate transporter DctM subunit
MDLAITFGLILALFVLLGSGIWIGLALLGVGWMGMELFTAARRGRRMAVTIWGASSSWTLTALPMFLWMGEILFRTKLSSDMFKGLAPWLEAPAGPPAPHQHHRLHHLRRGLRFLGRDLRHHRQDHPARAEAKRGYPEGITIGTLAGAGTLGLLIPPSIIMIVYGVAAERVDRQAVHRRRAARPPAGELFMGWIVVWALLNPGRSTRRRRAPDASVRSFTPRAT